ncbi:MAG: IS200/IS605 family transposase [Pyrinomonadaceae bacterium]|nr:IS200/IS605 family transposase [Pyrinomonadaceae bacterium]
MPSTHTSLNIHAVFSTKDRRPLIKASIRDDLFGYIGGITKRKGAVPIEIGGIEDHVHILLGVKPTIRLDHILRDIKAGSSGWLKRERQIPFAWQTGYGGFSVSPSRVNGVREYIRNQESHHRRVKFEEEYLSILEAGGVPYDPKYLW